MKLVDLLRPLMAVSPRQSIRLLDSLGAGWSYDAAWINVRPRYRSYFDRQLQCVLSSDLADWAGRSCYYWGRFFDFTHQATLRKYLSPGDTYIDIGANVGYQSMFASRLVGPSGQVLSFEPNPSTYSVLCGHLAINRIGNCRTFQMALSDIPGEAVLSQREEGTGTATLLPTDNPLRSVTVPVVRGDDVLRDIPMTGKIFIKIDVEGFEHRVLAGLGEILKRASAVTVEVIPEYLARQGDSPEALYREMREAGFRATIPMLHWKLGFFSPRLEFEDPAASMGTNHDVLFVR